MRSKRIGILSGIICGVMIVLIAFVFRVNLIFINSIGKIPFYYWLIFSITFLLFSFFGKNIGRKTFNWIYIGVAIISFIYLNSMLQWSVECCPDNYESMQDWNASKGLAWTINLPIVFVILIIQGLVFDILRELNLKRNKTV